jgi:hypothetical protein
MNKCNNINSLFLRVIDKRASEGKDFSKSVNRTVTKNRVLISDYKDRLKKHNTSDEVKKICLAVVDTIENYKIGSAIDLGYFLASKSHNYNMPPCFWCGIELSKESKTRDHLIPRPMHRILSTVSDLNNSIRPCCRQCNLQRGAITSIFHNIIFFSKDTAANKDKKQQKIIHNIEKHKPMIAFFRKKVRTAAMPRSLKVICTLELDLIDEFKHNPKLDCEAFLKERWIYQTKIDYIIARMKTICKSIREICNCLKGVLWYRYRYLKSS